MGTVKDRNGKDLIEAEEIKKRWKEYTEELYKKDINDPDSYDDVVTHSEPDILQCEVKQALGNTAVSESSKWELKCSGDDGISAGYLKS